MTSHQSVEINADGNTLCTSQSTDRDLTLVTNTVDLAEIIFSYQMDLIVNPGILADASLKTGFDDFTNELNCHPTLATLTGVNQCFGGGLGAYLRN
ncbi:hypothetical protein OB2597_12838 [Pseudooceanicola batsensis HTCC2597]|uniref:Uncharacterized protein n=1 Tax=Pseudooceanicola batsensis (strain ATCC BAA-863 / DSM 15984 / KCTC 12145 / HTCC2597) TaxID=252305 RepID=A3TXZ6_PSEBH|nr:hypothetical protein OB2597_12838 [Pseudooceanicola batsensis HTCC2597]